MPSSPDQYRNVMFKGVVPPPIMTASHERWIRRFRQAPPPSIFAKPYAPRPPVISPADRLLLEDIFRRAQLNGAAYRPTALGRRVPACLRALGARSTAEAQRKLELRPHLLDLALNALLIGVTLFYRDPGVFNHLRYTALPDLLRTSPTPRMLSLGCSDGSELYSLAILLRELGATGELRGIDCRRRAIHRARAATYPVSALANLSPELRDRYFHAVPRAFQINDDLRSACQFSVADAFIHLPQPPYDLIACRNFAIYLEHPAASRLWRRIHNALRPGGLLLAGKAEQPTSGFLRVGPCLFRKAPP